MDGNIKTGLSAGVKIAILLLFFTAVFIVFSVSNFPHKATVQFKILSSNQEVLQLFWLDGDGEYSQQQSSVIILKPGGHDYTLAIKPSASVSKLRLDPSTRKSVIEIEELKLKWDGDEVFSLSGQDLKKNFSVVQEVALDWKQPHSRLKITSVGVDPIIELDMTQLTGSFRRARLLVHMLWALVLTLPVVLSLLYLTSNSYIAGSHPIYPQLRRHWVYWGVSCIFSGVFLIVVTPINLSVKNPTLSFIAISYSIGLLLFIFSFWFATRKIRFVHPGNPMRFAWFWFALPSFIVWFIYLLAFWPGSMSPDSLLQWKQVLHGHFEDWHPAFHTMNIWLLTRIKLSPAIVAITQIIALGSTIGWALGVLQRYGVPKTVLWFTSLLFALWPVNGFMVITLWKDIAYSIALLVLAIYVFEIVMQKGAWLAQFKNWFFLGCILALVSLYRHNGVIPAFITVVFLFFFFAKYWKGIVFAATLALLIYAGIRGPLYNVLDVKRGNPMTHIQQKLKGDFFTSYYAKLKYKQIRKVLNRTKKEPVQTATGGDDKSVHHSGKIWDRIYSASVLWRILPIDFYYTRIDYVNLWQKVRNQEKRIKYVSSNKFGIHEDSIFSQGKEYLYMMYDESRYNKYFFWMWRPAVYLYAFTGLVMLLALRFRRKMYLVLVPSFINSLPMFLVVIHKSIFRYHYPIVVLCLVMLIPLLFLEMPPDEEQTDSLIC